MVWRKRSVTKYKSIVMLLSRRVGMMMTRRWFDWLVQLLIEAKVTATAVIASRQCNPRWQYPPLEIIHGGMGHFPNTFCSCTITYPRDLYSNLEMNNEESKVLSGLFLYIHVNDSPNYRYDRIWVPKESVHSRYRRTMPTNDEQKWHGGTSLSHILEYAFVQ